MKLEHYITGTATFTNLRGFDIEFAYISMQLSMTAAVNITLKWKDYSILKGMWKYSPCN